MGRVTLPTWNHCVLGFVPGTQYRLDELTGIISCCPDPDSGTPFLSPHSQRLGDAGYLLNTHHSLSRSPASLNPLIPSSLEDPEHRAPGPLLCGALTPTPGPFSPAGGSARPHPHPRCRSRCSSHPSRRAALLAVRALAGLWLLLRDGALCPRPQPILCCQPLTNSTSKI